MDPALLQRTAEIAGEYLASLPERAVRADASLDELRSRLRLALNDAPQPATEVIEQLATAAAPGLVGTQSPRYFGFVIGGSLDAAIAADWLTSVWDQNGAGYPGGPSAAVAEEVACEWLLDVLGLPRDAGVGLTTGCQMAHFTCLAAARHRVLADADWDVEADGLFGAPPIRVLVGAKAHTTVFAALRMLGLGSRRLELVPADDQGRMRHSELARLLASGARPAIVIAQVGEINTGAVDPMPEIARLAREHGAWCHVDGAFGLWAAASPRLRALVGGVAEADSWATDGHKWLNVPYDCGVAVVRDRTAHAAAMNSFAGAEYIPPPQHDERYQAEWVPEFSRRARGFAVYAALRELGPRARRARRAVLRMRAADGPGAGPRSPGHDPQRRRPQPGAGSLRARRRERDERGHRRGSARGNVLAQRHAMASRAGDADLRLQLAHERGRHPPLGPRDPVAGACRSGRAALALARATARRDGHA
jgi:glutamate/tyrosine decarboxylase-like PLP-dependent enzyme